RRRHTRFSRDWSSDVCSSDLGGWTTFVIGISMFSVMWAWSKARSIKKRYEKLIDIGPHLETITALSADTTISKYATNLVYLTSEIGRASCREKKKNKVMNG